MQRPVSTYLHTSLPICLPTYLSPTCLSIYASRVKYFTQPTKLYFHPKNLPTAYGKVMHLLGQPACPSACPSACHLPANRLPTCLPTCLLICLLTCLPTCLPKKVIFHQRLSSIKRCLPSMVVLHQRSSPIKGCLQSKIIFH